MNIESDVKWIPFVLSDIFEIYTSKGVIDENKLNFIEGINTNIPYITRSKKRNGLKKLVNKQKKNLNNANVITIGVDTQTVFFQSEPFYTGRNVVILYNKNLNKYNGLFIVTLLKKIIKKYSYGLGASKDRLKNKNLKIYLPADNNNNPHFEYMEKFMKNIELNEKNKIKEKELNEVDESNIDLKKVKWKPFKLSDIGEIKSGKDIPKKERIKGDIPYISSKSEDNGVEDFVNNQNNTLSSNCISINRNGSVGEAFYHPYEAVYSNDCRRFFLNNSNKFVALFIVTLIKKQKEKYSWGYKMGTKRLLNQKIMLPVNKNESPDYDFMENYMKYIENKFLSTNENE